MKKLLDGVKILDLTRLLPGPYCTMLFADMGADVLKIESSTGPDAARFAEPRLNKNSQVFCHINRGKRSLALDLRDPLGIEVFHRLVKSFDVVVEGFRPGVMVKMGLGYAALKKINPKLVFCSITGYGQTGPYRDRPGHDINYIGYAGILDQSGRKGEPPSLSNFQIADLAGGALMAATTILAAYIYAQRTGDGSELDVSMLDGSLALSPLALGSHVLSQRIGRELSRGESFLNGGTPCYQVYETKDGRYMALGAFEAKFWKRFLELIDRKDLEPYHMASGTKGEKLFAELSQVFKAKTQSEWTQLLAHEETCCTPVLTFGEAMMNEQINARHMIRNENLPEEGSVQHISFPVKVDSTDIVCGPPAPQIGEHSREVLSSLGFTGEQVQALLDHGTIR